MPDKNLNTTPAPQENVTTDATPKTTTFENDPRIPFIQEYIKDWIDQNPEFKKKHGRPEDQE